MRIQKLLFLHIWRHALQHWNDWSLEVLVPRKIASEHSIEGVCGETYLWAP